MKARIAVILAALIFAFGPGVVLAQLVFPGAGGGGGVCGSTTQIQFNSSGSCGASADLTWNDSTKVFNVYSSFNPINAGSFTTWGKLPGAADMSTASYSPSGNSLTTSINGTPLIVVGPAGANGNGVNGVYATESTNLGFSAFNTASSAAFQWDSAGVIGVNNGQQTSQGGTYKDLKIAKLQAGILFSAAGTALPTCVAGLKGTEATVSDATTPTYGGAYTSGGGVTAKVICDGAGGWSTR